VTPATAALPFPFAHRNLREVAEEAALRRCRYGQLSRRQRGRLRHLQDKRRRAGIGVDGIATALPYWVKAPPAGARR
jgi:hypothetical protein